MSTPKRRHKWSPNPDAPTREDMRMCARPDCSMLRNDFGSQRYEYRTKDWRFIANRKRRDPAPPCEPKPKENP